jgi:hypothetical protein
MEALLRLRRICCIRRTLERVEEGLQTADRVFEIRRVALQVGKDLRLREASARLERFESLLGRGRVVRKGVTRERQRILDRLTVSRRRGDVRGGLQRAPKSQRQRRERRNPDDPNDVARLQRALTTPAAAWPRAGRAGKGRWLLSARAGRSR